MELNERHEAGYTTTGLRSRQTSRPVLEGLVPSSRDHDELRVSAVRTITLRITSWADLDVWRELEVRAATKTPYVEVSPLCRHRTRDHT